METEKSQSLISFKDSLSPELKTFKAEGRVDLKRVCSLLQAPINLLPGQPLKHANPETHLSNPLTPRNKNNTSATTAAGVEPGFTPGQLLDLKFRRQELNLAKEASLLGVESESTSVCSSSKEETSPNIAHKSTLPCDLEFSILCDDIVSGMETNERAGVCLKVMASLRS